MKNHQIVVVAVVVGAICVAGCKKDPKPAMPSPVSPQPDSSRKYFPMQIKNSDFYVSYTYGWDEQVVLSSVQKVYDNVDTMYGLSSANELGQPLSFRIYSEGVGLSETQYTLNLAGNVIRGDVYTLKKEEFRPHYIPDTLKAFYILSYNSFNQLTQVSYYRADGQKDHDDTFFYTSDGNIREVNSLVNIKLEYDRFKGIGKNVRNSYLFYIEGADQLLFHSNNNPTRFNGLSRSYKYNLDDYPVEMIIQNAKGPQIFNITYYVTPEL